MLNNYFELCGIWTEEVLNVIKKEFKINFWNCEIRSENEYPIINIEISGTNKGNEDVIKLLNVLKSLDTVYLNPYDTLYNTDEFILSCTRKNNKKPGFKINFFYDPFFFEENENLADFVKYLWEEDNIDFEKICKDLEFLKM